MRQCDAVWIFGISEGVMGEFQNALLMRDSGANIEILGFYDFDPEWEKYYAELQPKYGDLISKLRGDNRLIALVGQRAVGKTFWIDYLTEQFPRKIRKIKNTTTREPRDLRDRTAYNFISKDEFVQMIDAGTFLEYDTNDGEYYGSSIVAIQRTLAESDGIFAITPKGAEELYKYRRSVNLKIILLRPESEDVMRRNFGRREIMDSKEQNKLLEIAANLKLSEGVEYVTITLTGNTDEDKDRIISAIYPEI